MVEVGVGVEDGGGGYARVLHELDGGAETKMVMMMMERRAIGLVAS